MCRFDSGPGHQTLKAVKFQRLSGFFYACLKLPSSLNRRKNKIAFGAKTILVAIACGLSSPESVVVQSLAYSQNPAFPVTFIHLKSIELTSTGAVATLTGRPVETAPFRARARRGLDRALRGLMTGSRIGYKCRMTGHPYSPVSTRPRGHERLPTACPHLIAQAKGPALRGLVVSVEARLLLHQAARLNLLHSRQPVGLEGADRIPHEVIDCMAEHLLQRLNLIARKHPGSIHHISKA